MAKLLTGIRIIVVEDHHDSREIVATMLQFYGAAVTAVSTAGEAVRVVANADADIVVTDFSMPGEDGAWLLERVNEQPRPIPVVVLSGFAESHLLRLADAPFARKLLKPIDPEDLSRVILQVLQR
jgi:CheY-like chemotaxis protein